MPTTSNFLYELRVVAKDLVERIGYETLYTSNNPSNSNELENHYLNQVETVTNFIRGFLAKLEVPKSLILKFDNLAKSTIYGLYTDYNDGVYIVLSPANNQCWKRFSLLKELCSVYISVGKIESHQSVKSQDYLEALKNAFNQKSKFISLEPFGDNDVDDETYAILLATELMIPVFHRKRTRELVAMVEQNAVNENGDKLKLNDVARSLMMPEFILKKYLDYDLLNEAPEYEDLN